jgi:hypothetical protein
MVSAAILSCLVLAAQPRSDVPLELQLQVLTPAVRRGSAVVVRVVVRNPPEAKRTWYLVPGFWPLPYTSPSGADLALRVEVRDRTGHLLPATRAMLVVARMTTYPSAFNALRPGQLFGEDVVITSEAFGFSFPAAGKYIISATVATEAQRWFDRWLREQRHPGQVPFDRESLFVGPIGAGPVTVDVTE